MALRRALSFAGFLGGAVAGALFAPAISRALVGGQNQQDLVAVIRDFMVPNPDVR